MEKKKKVLRKPPEDPIEKIYGREKEENKKNLQKISRPAEKNENGPAARILLLIIVLILAGAGVWWVFFKAAPTASKPKENSPAAAGDWYAVKLVDGEIFYGQIGDTKADPVVINNVYYNYEQAKDGQKAVDENASLKLVKRGKETHGPTGALNVVRSQVIYMEPLASDSKVLKAILEYEK